jgi:hypothetical protein
VLVQQGACLQKVRTEGALSRQLRVSLYLIYIFVEVGLPCCVTLVSAVVVLML